MGLKRVVSCTNLKVGRLVESPQNSFINNILPDIRVTSTGCGLKQSLCIMSVWGMNLTSNIRVDCELVMYLGTILFETSPYLLASCAFALSHRRHPFCFVL